MITLEQHLAAHWPTVHTRAGLHWSHMYQCKCGWMPPQDDPRPIEVIHAAHVAATWREARTVRTVEDVAALQDDTEIMFIDADGDPFAERHRITGGMPEGFDERGLEFWLNEMTAIVVWTPEDGVL